MGKGLLGDFGENEILMFIRRYLQEVMVEQMGMV